VVAATGAPPLNATAAAPPASLDAWFRESGLVDDGTHADTADLHKAIDLREAVYTLAAGRLFSEPVDQAAVALLNEFAATPPVVPQLTATGRRVEATAAQALSSVARQAVDILGGPEADLLKECGRPECTQVYLDHSRGFRREWCAMRTCGSRMKAAAYRSRKREETR
jgi:predicted RNA-binding Zn ribbon-like protein